MIIFYSRNSEKLTFNIFKYQRCLVYMIFIISLSDVVVTTSVPVETRKVS